MRATRIDIPVNLLPLFVGIIFISDEFKHLEHPQGGIAPGDNLVIRYREYPSGFRIKG